MKKWVKIILQSLISSTRSRLDLAFENLLLRQQLAAMKHRQPRPKLSKADRMFWVLFSKIWPNWRDALHIVTPETAVRWHRQGFRYYWTWKSRRSGRPKVDREIRDLIRDMCRANPLWGAPRIHGELLKLGLDVSEATVSKYMIRDRRPPSQTWRTFLENHAKDLVAIDFFAVPTATFRVLFVLVILSHDRRRILHFNATEHPTAAWTARQLFEALGMDEAPSFLLRDRDAIYGDTIVLGERHLRRIIRNYVSYYNNVRTHLSLVKDAPDRRPVQAPKLGKIVSRRYCGGLHHEYFRTAA